MENFNDPVILSRDYSAVMKLWHTVGGLYLWEFFTTLDYEWSVIRGNRPYRWTIWVYSCTRVATLLALVENMIIFYVSGRINCQLWVTFQLLLAHTAVATASLLIVLRVIAVWNRNRIVYAIAMGAWATNLACLIRSIVLVRSVWSPLTTTCMSPNSVVTDLNWIVSLSTDTLLLLTMLLSLFRWRYENGSASSLRRLLWRQGLIWLLLATIAYVPPVVFISLKLNASFNMMFQTPALVTLSIAATRMYRSLTDFRSHDISVSPPQENNFVASVADRIRVARIPPNRMEVVMHTESEQHPASQADHHGSSIITDGQLRDRPPGLNIGEGVESCMEK